MLAGLGFLVSRRAYESCCQKCGRLLNTTEGFGEKWIKVVCQITTFSECPNNAEDFGFNKES